MINILAPLRRRGTKLVATASSRSHVRTAMLPTRARRGCGDDLRARGNCIARDLCLQRRRERRGRRGRCARTHGRKDGDARSLTRRAARSDIQYGPRARSRKKTKPKSAAVGPMWRLIWAITFNDNYFYILIAARSPCLVLFAHEGGKRT
jgi:hypothetical protein